MKKKTTTQKHTPNESSHYSKALADADKNSRRRNAIKFSQLEELDNIGTSEDNFMIPGYKHYGGDKFSAAVSNHTAKNWGFGTGVKNNDDEKKHNSGRKKKN